MAYLQGLDGEFFEIPDEELENYRVSKDALEKWIKDFEEENSEIAVDEDEFEDFPPVEMPPSFPGCLVNIQIFGGNSGSESPLPQEEDESFMPGHPAFLVPSMLGGIGWKNGGWKLGGRGGQWKNGGWKLGGGGGPKIKVLIPTNIKIHNKSAGPCWVKVDKTAKKGNTNWFKIEGGGKETWKRYAFHTTKIYLSNEHGGGDPIHQKTVKLDISTNHFDIIDDRIKEG